MACLSWSCQQETSTPAIKSLASKSSMVKIMRNFELETSVWKIGAQSKTTNN